MAERELLQLGEVAKMYRLSAGTLRHRHYEQLSSVQQLFCCAKTGPAVQ